MERELGAEDDDDDDDAVVDFARDSLETVVSKCDIF